MVKTILLVEDEPMIRRMYKSALEQEQFQVIEAEDGEQALTHLEKPHTIDLVLLDLMLPKVDGITLLKKIRQPNAISFKTPVFLLTNLGLDELVEEALSLGAAKYIIKANIFPDDLVQIVKEWTNQPPNPAHQ